MLAGSGVDGCSQTHQHWALFAGGSRVYKKSLMMQILTTFSK